MAEHWHAGWNMAGYLPETPYRCFADPSDAVNYLVEALERDEETCAEDHGCVEAGFCTSVEVLRSARADGDHVTGCWVPHGDWMRYCVDPCDDPGCEHVPEAEDCPACDLY